MMHRQTGHMIAAGLLAAILAIAPVMSAAETDAASRTQSDAASVERDGTERTFTARPDETATVTTRPCPPFCVSPMNIAEGVTTVAEVEVIQFEQTAQWNGNGVLIDARSPAAYRQGTIPGSVNIPLRVFESPMDDPELVQALRSFGAEERSVALSVTRVLETMGIIKDRKRSGAWDFSNARDLLLWCSGPRCEQSPRAIRALIALGYPTEKLYYYRGGMQMWQSLGLETVKPGEASSYASK